MPRTQTLDAARRAGVRCVLTSSFLALGPSRPGECPSEDGPFLTPPEPQTPYAATKRRARAIAHTALQRGDNLVVLIPGALYGPGPDRESNYVGTMVDRLLRGQLFALPGGGRTRLTWSWVHDVARAHVTALSSATRGEYIVGGPAASVAEALAIVARHARRRVPRASISLGVLAAAGVITEAIARARGTVPLWTRAEIAAYRVDWTYRSDRAAAELGYRMTSLEDGFATMLRARGVIT